MQGDRVQSNSYVLTLLSQIVAAGDPLQAQNPTSLYEDVQGLPVEPRMDYSVFELDSFKRMFKWSASSDSGRFNPLLAHTCATV